MKLIRNKLAALKAAFAAGAAYVGTLGVAHAQSISSAVSGGTACSTTSGTASDPFQGFLCLLYQWTAGDLGIALALLGLLFGVFWGLGKGSLAPALVGVGIAAVFMLGPNVIAYIVTGAQIAPAIIGG